jgi:hypothetical protein
MSDIYCGIGKIPKGQKMGTMRECAEKGQVRYYGIKKIDAKTLSLAKNKDVVPETKEKLILSMVSLRGIIKRNKGRYEGAKEKKAADEYHKIWQDAEKKLAKVIAKLKKIEDASNKKTSSKKSTKKSATKSRKTSRGKSVKKTKKGTKKSSKSSKKSSRKSSKRGSKKGSKKSSKRV